MSKAQSDIIKVIPANGGMNVPTRGEFVFIKNASAKLRVTIHNEPVEMEAGDVRRVDTPFDSFEIVNLSGIDQRVEIVAGFGHYNRLVVRGDISSFPAVIGADGVPRPDSRTTIGVDLGFIDPTQYHEDFGDLGENLTPTLFGATITMSGMRGYGYTNDGSKLLVGQSTGYQIYDAQSGAYIGFQATPGGSRSYFTYHPTEGLLISSDNYPNQAKWYHVDNSGTVGAVWRNYNSPAGNQSSYQACFTTAGYYVDIGSLGNIVIKDPSGVLLHNENFGSAQYSFTPDPASGIHVLAQHYGSPNALYRVNVLTLEKEKIADGLPLPWSISGTDFSASAVRYNHLQDRFEWGIPNVRSVVTKTADYWGKVASKRVVDSGVFLSAESSPVEILDTSAPMFFEPSGQYWRVDWVRVALEKYFKARGGKDLPSDYLDYVFGITINGEPLEGDSYESFLRQGIADDFTATMPARVELTVSKELKYL